MSEVPRLEKVGRNAPCPCASGKKFKHCHGTFAPFPEPPGFQQAIEQQFKLQEAQQKIRDQQQGFGRQVISIEFKGQRFVAIGGRLMWSKAWRYFTDFLLDYLKEVMGVDWLKKTRDEGIDHPIIRWVSKLWEMQKANPNSGTAGVPSTGYMTALFGLAYSLYLIAHHDQIPASMVRRLRRPDHFRFAAYETIVASAFALAGSKIKDAEEHSNKDKSPEFYATLKSGRRVSVEAKCKDAWKSKIDPNDEGFQNELKQWIRDKLYKASQKKLHNAAYWFELSIPDNLDEPTWRKIGDLVNIFIKDAADSITINGALPVPAYVVVTNHAYLVNDDSKGAVRVAFLEPFRIPDLNTKGFMDLETAMENADRHRDFTWVLDCLGKIQQIPMTFDGTPPELLGPEGKPLRPMQIGDRLELSMQDGSTLRGKLHDVVSNGDAATVVLEGEDGQHRIATMPLTREEARAAAIYGDMVFGKPDGQRKGLGPDPLAIYDWLLEVYAAYPREGLLTQVKKHADYEQFAALPTDKLRVRAAREIAKAFISQTQRPA
jgi:hypothetical protein